PLGGGGSKPARTRGGGDDEGDVGEADAASANPWAVLEDRPRKKKRRKAAKGDDDSRAEARAADEPDGIGRDAGDARRERRAAAEEETAGESPRDVAAEFVRTVPADVAYPSFLRYLVWGGVVPAEGSRGDGARAFDSRDFEGPALLDSPFLLDGDQPSNGGVDDGGLEASFQLLRRLNEPLVLHLVGAYPGLLPGLFVHVIESFICLASGGGNDGGRRRRGRTGRRPPREVGVVPPLARVPHARGPVRGAPTRRPAVAQEAHLPGPVGRPQEEGEEEVDPRRGGLHARSRRPGRPLGGGRAPELGLRPARRRGRRVFRGGGDGAASRAGGRAL
ncbi:hypothetical protein THAOC_00535, partial [Thalassiosira oceanica]